MRTFLLACLPLLAAAASSTRPLLGANQPCWDKVKELDAISEENGGQLPLGGQYPTCDRLGRFSPKQCSGSQCYCVSPQGEQLLSSSQEKYTKNKWEAADMACRCAREEHEIGEAGQLGVTVRCDAKGDYHHTQCLGSSCYCIHPVTGQVQEGTQAHVADFAALYKTCSTREV